MLVETVKSDRNRWNPAQKENVWQKQAVRRGPTRVQRKESENTHFGGHLKSQKSANFWQTRPEISNFWVFLKITFLHSLRLAFMQKIREIQYAVIEKCGKPSILGIFDHFGSNFGQTRPKMTNFWVFLKKTKTSLFYTP